MISTRVAKVTLGGLGIAWLLGTAIGLIAGAWSVLGIAIAATFFVVLALVWLDTPAEAMEDWVP